VFYNLAIIFYAYSFYYLCTSNNTKAAGKVLTLVVFVRSGTHEHPYIGAGVYANIISRSRYSIHLAFNILLLTVWYKHRLFTYIPVVIIYLFISIIVSILFNMHPLPPLPSACHVKYVYRVFCGVS